MFRKSDYFNNSNFKCLMSNKINWSLSTIILFLAFSGCKTTRQPEAIGVWNPTANGNLTILALNDMHASIDNFPKLAAIVDSIRSIHPNLLLFSAGDNRTGNPVNDRYPRVSYPMMALMNNLRFDASAVGNHEFDGGVAGLRELIQNSTFRYLCANMDAPDSMRLHVIPYRFFERNGLRIGVLGLIQLGNQGTPDCHPDNVRGISFSPAVKVIPEYLEWMRKQCDILILLTHYGHENDQKLAEQFPKADIIIGGHSHTLVKTTELSNGVLVTQAGNLAKYLTEITVKVTNGKVTDKQSHLIDVRAASNKSQSVQSLVDKFNDNEELNKILTVAEAPFTEKEELGSLMADALRVETGADIALQNAGGVRFSEHPAGEFTMKDVLMLDPFANEMLMFNLTGEEINLLLASAAHTDEYGPSFVSGIRYKIWLDKNADAKRVEVFLPNGTPLDKAKTYRVAMSSYQASVAKYEHNDPGQPLFSNSADLLANFLGKQKSLNYKGVKRVEIIRE